MSATKSNEPYKQLRVPPPPPAKPKQPLAKTVSAPHAALNRLLGRQQNSDGDGEEATRREEKERGKGMRRRVKNGSGKRKIEIGEDVLTSESLPPSPGGVVEGNLIDLDTDDASSISTSASSTSLSSCSPSLRSMSTSGRPQRRPPPPPPDRVRLATVSGGPVKTSGSGKVRPVPPDRVRLATVSGGPVKTSGSGKVRPVPPPKPTYLSSPPEEQTELIQTGANDEGQRIEVESRDRPQPKPRIKMPSPYLMFTPKEGKPPNQPSQERPSSRETSTHTSSPDSSSNSLPPTPPFETKTSAVVAKPHPITYPTPPPREMEYTEREHPRNVFEYLDKMRQRGDLCDVTLVATSCEIRAHKVVLAACSQYFESMFIGEFAEPDGEPIIMEEVDDDALEALVNFAYTSRIRLTDRNIYLIFSAADLLQFSGVRGACFKFFKQQMNKSNCIRTWLFAEAHNCTELLDAALKYIECNFLDVVRGREFLSLDRADVVTKLLELEDIAVTSEEQVYEAALSWLQQDSQGRTGDAAVEVLKSVRFPNMSRDYLMHIVDTEQIIKQNSECLKMLTDALESFVTGTRTRLRKKLLKQQDSTSSYANVKIRPASMAVETVEFCREDQSLGLRIMGGAERPYHVFRQGDKPGIFILMVTSNGVATKTGKLKTGDRILKLNGVDMTTITHDQAIRLLMTTPDPLSMLVRHEPPPTGLQELTLVTKPGEGFGISLSGGVNGYHGNLLDETDEGIFISQIIPGGTAEKDGRLKEGTRILQVNSISMLGKTHAEALHVLQGVLDRINLLVCFGYDPVTLLLSNAGSGEAFDTVDEFGYVGSESMYNRKSNGTGGGGGGGGGEGVVV